MRQATTTLRISTPRRGLLDITADVTNWLAEQSVGTGLLTLFCRHTSASLLIQENAAPEVRSDLEAFFERIAPEDWNLYAHRDEGPDDMPAHVKTMLTSTSLQIPVLNGELMLGTWQAPYLIEHRRRPHSREIVLQFVGETHQ